MAEAEYGKLKDVLTRLYRHIQQGNVDPDLDAAYWTVERAMMGRASADVAIRYATEVLERVDPGVRKPVDLPVRAVSKSEHDAMFGEKTTTTLTPEEYQRMIKEAQEQ